MLPTWAIYSLYIYVIVCIHTLNARMQADHIEIWKCCLICYIKLCFSYSCLRCGTRCRNRNKIASHTIQIWSCSKVLYHCPAQSTITNARENAVCCCLLLLLLPLFIFLLMVKMLKPTSSVSRNLMLSSITPKGSLYC